MQFLYLFYGKMTQVTFFQNVYFFQQKIVQLTESFTNGMASRQRQDSFIDDLNTTSEVKKVQLHTPISIYFYLLIISTTILFFILMCIYTIINCTIFRICNPSCTYIKLKIGDNTSNLRLLPSKFWQKNPNRTKEIIRWIGRPYLEISSRKNPWHPSFYSSSY